MAGKKQPPLISKGYYDLSGAWHPVVMPEKITKASKESVNKAIAKANMSAKVAQAIADMDRIARGDIYENEYSRCPECLIVGKVDVHQLNHCYKHNWFDESEVSGWLMQGQTRIGVKLIRPEPPLQTRTIPLADKKPVKQHKIKTIDYHLKTENVEIGACGAGLLRRHAKRLNVIYGILKGMEDTRQYHDMPLGTQALHQASIEKVKAEYMAIREYLQQPTEEIAKMVIAITTIKRPVPTED